MIAIIDYEMGNLGSVAKALTYLGQRVEVTSDPDVIFRADRVILPGVGAMSYALEQLEKKGLDEAIRQYLVTGRPFLGICLGMQLMARRGFEGGAQEGLGWFDGEVVRLPQETPAVRLPHVGWNEASPRTASVLFRELPPRPDFYFVHSYHLQCRDAADVEAVCEYGIPFAAAVRKENVFATQFHPEKSQDYGIKVLENFLKWRP